MTYLSIQCTRNPIYTLYSMYVKYRHTHTFTGVRTRMEKHSPSEPAMSAEVLACSSTQDWNTELLSRKGTAQLVGTNTFLLFLPDVKQHSSTATTVHLCITGTQRILSQAHHVFCMHVFQQRRTVCAFFCVCYPQLPGRNEAMTATILPDKFPNHNLGALPDFLSVLIKVFFDGSYCALV